MSGLELFPRETVARITLVSVSDALVTLKVETPRSDSAQPWHANEVSLSRVHSDTLEITSRALRYEDLMQAAEQVKQEADDVLQKAAKT